MSTLLATPRKVKLGRKHSPECQKHCMMMRILSTKVKEGWKEA